MNIDNGGGGNPVHDPSCPPGLAAAMRAEAEAILNTPIFRRSAMVARLLSFLVEATVAGRAQVLKSYTVAVDGLGRSSDYDASDSYARVQMGRLRKMLHSHYAEHGPADELCIYLQPGSYVVRAGPLATSYPTLYRPLSASSAGKASEDHGQSEPTVAKMAETAATRTPRARTSKQKWIISAAIVAALVTIASLAFVWQTNRANTATKVSPVLEFTPVFTHDEQDHDKLARAVSSAFTDGLPRFKLSRVRVITAGDDIREANNSEHVYRLVSRIEEYQQGGPTLFLRLNDVQTNTILWSREMKLPDDSVLASQAISPLLAEINGPFGAIATREAIIYQNWNTGGYICVLKYFTFVATREKGIENKVRQCLEKPVEEEEMVAVILATRALFTLEQSNARNNIRAAAEQAMTFARAAVAADPDDGSANFAAARISYAVNDCVSARYYTDRTLETNPKSPMFTATLAALANICAYPDADRLLDVAFQVQSSKYAKGRLLLVMAALSQGRPEKIKDIIASDLPEKPYNRINYYLAETLIAASQGKRRDAALNWKLFSQLMRPESKTPDEKLRTIILHPDMRRKVVAMLQKGGAFAA